MASEILIHPLHFSVITLEIRHGWFFSIARQLPSPCHWWSALLHQRSKATTNLQSYVCCGHELSSFHHSSCAYQSSKWLGQTKFYFELWCLAFVVSIPFWVLWFFHLNILNLGRWIPFLFFLYVLSINLGGQWGRTSFHIFTIPDNNAYDLWRLEMVAHHQTLEEPPTSRIFIFPESSPCIAEIVEAGGCVDPVLTETCLKSVPVSFRRPDPAENLKVALHMSFKTKTTITLGHRVWPLQHTFIIFYFLAIQSIPESHIDLIQLYHIT